MTAETRRILLEAAVIVALGVVLGLSVNYRLIRSAFEGENAAPTGTLRSTSATTPLPAPVDLATLRAAMGRGILLVDARSRELFRRGHLPGARSFPLEQAKQWMDRFRKAFPPGTSLIVYCEGDGCPDAFHLAARLLKQGYRRVRVFEGGFSAWRQAGLPVVRGRR